MGALKAARDGLEAVVKASGIPTVYDHIPERPHPPCAQMAFGSPYLEDGDVFGTSLVRFEVDVIPRLGTNRTITDELEKVIEDLYPILVNAGYSLDSVSQPKGMQINNAVYLGATFNISTHVAI